ncbi:MAG: hypothetical protein NVS3B20_13570 [Polyangiales bacterium]
MSAGTRRTGGVGHRKLASLLLVTWCVLTTTTIGCGTKEDASLDVYAQDLMLTKGGNAFGAKLEGSMKVTFDLGHYSGANVHVDAISLQLYRSGAVILGGRARLVPVAADPKLPFDLSPGQKISIRYEVHGNSATEPLQLTDTDAMEVCRGPISAEGTVQQAGKADPIRIGAAPVLPQGCS